MLEKLGLDRGFFIYGGVLSALAALVYLPLAPTFGLYRDDWYLIWAGRTQYLSTIVDMFSIDRPAMGYLYTRTYLLLGDDPTNWVVFSFLVRLAGAWGFLALLRVVWTEKRFMGFAASLLFLIYPGFLQMPNAVTFNNHVITLTLIVFSLLMTAVSLKIENRWLGIGAVAFALALQAAYLPIYEYMIGLEGMRFVLIWYMSDNAVGVLQRVRIAILRYLPYAFVVAGFMYWRIFLFKSGRPTTDVGRLASTYAEDPFAALGQFLSDAFKDILDATLFAWSVPPYQLISRISGCDLLTGILIAIVCVVVFLWAARKFDRDEPGSAWTSWDWVFIGLLGLVFSVTPVILAGRHIVYSSNFDRYTLHTTLGVSLLFAGLISLNGTRRSRHALASALIFLAALTHYANGVHFKNAWQSQRELWWQVSWRVPQFEPETLIMANLAGAYSYEEGYEVWAPANIIYAPQLGVPSIKAEVIVPQVYEALMRGAVESEFMRNMNFEHDFGKALILSAPARGACVHFYDGSAYPGSRVEPALIRWLSAYSRLEQIRTEGEPPELPAVIFGEEPPHAWCYYYQKISLARQREDWQSAASLGDEALAKGFSPVDYSEWMPLLEAYAMLENDERVREILSQMPGSDQRYLMCLFTLAQGYSQPGYIGLRQSLCNNP